MVPMEFTTVLNLFRGIHPMIRLDLLITAESALLQISTMQMFHSYTSRLKTVQFMLLTMKVSTLPVTPEVQSILAASRMILLPS